MELAQRQWVIEQIGYIKDYHVFLTQSGTNAPSVFILHDSIKYIAVTRSGAGTYLFTRTDAFPMDKSVPKDVVVAYDKDGNKLKLTHVSKDQYKLETYAVADLEVLADGVLTNQELHLNVYR